MTAGDRPVRSLTAGGTRPGVPRLVVVPGLGALGYLRPLLAACATWTSATLLDVPGFGHRATARCPSSLHDVASTVSAWLQTTRDPVLLVGHSTGAQAALRAAVDRPERVAGLVLAGPTFPPDARRWRPLVARAVRTARHERIAEVPAVLPEYLRGRSRVVTLLRSAMADRPEDAVGALTVPHLVVRGRDDALAPEDWVRRLAGNATALTVPGAHNFPFTHPAEASAALRRWAAGLG